MKRGTTQLAGFGKNGRFGWPILFLLLLTGFLLWQSPPQTAFAQEQNPAYWRHSAPRRINHILNEDINHDGVDEFVIAAENGRIELLNSVGDLQWSHAAGDIVQAIGTANLDGDQAMEIAFVSERNLTVLNSEGRELWSSVLNTLAPPQALLAFGSQEAGQAWQAQYQIQVRQIESFDYNGNGRDELLLLFDDGQLQLYSETGSRIWVDDSNSYPLRDNPAVMTVLDLNQDGQQEIALGYFNPTLRFSQLRLINGQGQDIWADKHPIPNRVSTLAVVPFGENGEPLLAIGSEGGQIHLINSERQRAWWPRTLNKAITVLTVGEHAGEPLLLAGTEVGVVVAYRANGSRLWTRRLATEANRAVVSLTAARLGSGENAPLLAAALAPPAEVDGGNDVLLLGPTGRTLATYEAVDDSGFTRLLDINQDGRYELFLARFATVELLGLGAGTSEIAPEWSYSLDSEPGDILVVDFNQDGEDELVIGARDGRLHYLNQQNELDWLVSPGGIITHLALLEANQSQQIVVIRNNSVQEPDNEQIFEGWVDVRDINGEQIWEAPLSANITSLLLQNVNEQNDPEIIVGTHDGQIVAFSTAGAELWRERTVGEGQPGKPISHLLLTNHLITQEPMLIAAADNQLYAVEIRSPFPAPIIATYASPISDLYQLNQPGEELAIRLLVFVNGEVSGLTWRGIRMPAWPVPLEGNPIISIPANDAVEETFEEGPSESFLIATDQAVLSRLRVQDSEPTQVWRLIGLNNITSLYWGDLTGDAQPEFVVGNSEGSEGYIYLYSNQTELIDEIPLSSGVFDLLVIRNDGQIAADLLVITENGVVQLFRAQENHPPLLTAPQVEGQYNFSVSVTDVEGDEVTVRLEILNPATGIWESQGAKIIANGNDRTFWTVSELPENDGSVTYRLTYDDGAYQGELTPLTSRVAVPNNSLLPPTTATLTILGLVTAVSLFVLVRQSQLPANRARRFYRQLKNQSEATLTLLESRYNLSNASPDFLIYLASRARHQGDSLVSSLADGLFLLADRPRVGLTIILGALDDAQEKRLGWQQLERWQRLFQTSQALLGAPTITEISLLRPQLVHLLEYLEQQDKWPPTLDALLPIMTNLRDSERVDLPDDRLVYLNEATHLLSELQQALPAFSVRIEKTLAAAIVRRWMGVATAASAELRGQATLVVQLKTKRIVSSEQTSVTLLLTNNGRSPAENVITVLNEDPGYLVQSDPQYIALLPPGRSRAVSFQLEPQVTDRFRLGLTVSYKDRTQHNREIAFGDMVHLLQPTRNFKPIFNPYLPGTPLRSNSPLFFGQERLFHFIADNAGKWSQRNVLILIGQRRTGKTSTLLRLGQHLPDDLLPVYIDCQSLGVSPGMGALFHDMAWLISDALALRDIEIDVPPPDMWQTDPTGEFQRRFIPKAKSLLPLDTTLLLLFDEFEAFENLVEDGILPPTFFSFMRHLMQHSEGLSFIFVGTRRLEEMSADYWSVLFNIALYERITFLSEDAAVRLITEPVAPDLVYDDLAIDKILRVTAGQPYFVQLVCYTLVQRANRERTGYVTISDVNAGLAEMLSLGEVHFAYLWQRSSEAERVVLTAVAHMSSDDTTLHPSDIVDFLEPFGIQLPPTEITAALHRLVEREIMRELNDGANTLYELKIGLVGLWVAQHKSLSRLHARRGNGTAVTPKTRLSSRR
ncbi:AAA family ATPase [Candidatus Leptofilum sp.]|uniref:AAA family ATPase n=1 Tax=Candidatus Leptofilum sp. TaxID=3241576 RepID=UPI003B5C9113